MRGLGYRSGVKPIWCPACGDYGVLSATLKAFEELDLDPQKVVFTAGIGCSSRLPGYVKSYRFHTIHGRPIPTAMGVKLANPSLTVIAVGGDGDLLAIGGNHFIHAARRNIDITCLMLDNSVYGMTRGQFSPTSPLGLETRSAPYGSPEYSFDPIPLALSSGATFIARGFSGRVQHLSKLILEGIRHNGFSFIQVLSPCVTFYDTTSFLKEKVEEIPGKHDIGDKVKAFELCTREDRILLGIFYTERKETFDERIKEINKKAMAGGVPSIKDLLNRFR